MAKTLYTTNKPKELFVIFDALDGAHLSTTLGAAEKLLAKWKKDAGLYDSSWDMVGPVRYIKEETT